MVDKIVSVPRASITSEIGHCEDSELRIIDEALRRWLSLD
jgi:mRNA-degrading endonuclease toxin of MazEF toxin-antitoxin module